MELDLHAFDGLFEEGQGPNINSVTQTDDEYVIKFKVSTDLTWFKGHFVGNPVLPGVVQVDWAGELTKFLFADVGQLREIANLKFKYVIIPELELLLTLRLDSARKTVAFIYTGGGVTYSSGIFRFLDA